jgi:hypothetical protein
MTFANSAKAAAWGRTARQKGFADRSGLNEYFLGGQPQGRSSPDWAARRASSAHPVQPGPWRAAGGNIAESENKVTILISLKIVHSEKGTPHERMLPSLVAGSRLAVAGTIPEWLLQRQEAEAASGWPRCR